MSSMLVPAPSLLIASGVWVALAIAASAFPDWRPAWPALGALLLLIVCIDAWRALRQPRPEVRRRHPQALAIGNATEIVLEVSNPHHQFLHLSVFDHPPPGLEFSGLPLRVDLPPGEGAHLRYRVEAHRRGEHRFGSSELRLRSPWRFWWLNCMGAAPALVRVYPNFAALTKYALFATDHRLSQLGILQRRRRGEGLDFHQLRDYREGDAPRQIDWKATARLQRLVSREYRDERDQQIILVLDCGRRMAAQDGPLSHLDHALNAALLLAHVALRQGDAVGLLTFAGPARWLAPRKSAATINTLLEHSFDLQPTLASPDYYAAAVAIMQRARKRAMVVLLTNLRDEDDAGLSAALSLLRRRHLVVLASLREVLIDQTLAAQVDDLDCALSHAATAAYLARRQRLFQRIEHGNTPCLDVPPPQLPMALVNRYSALKRSGSM